MPNSNRQPLIQVDWFIKSNGALAIADVVYVEGIGLCSHQPTVAVENEHYLMVDIKEKTHIVKADCLFVVSPDEHRWYWQNIQWT